MRTLVLSALCMAALAGCHSTSATLTFTPAALKDCGDNKNAPVAIEVHWDATKAKLKRGVEVRVSNVKASVRSGVFGGAHGTQWTTGGNIGSATTGVWVFPGTTFYLTDPSNGDVLVIEKVPAAPCK